MKFFAEYEIKFCRYNTKEYKEIEIENANKEYYEIVKRVNIFYKRNLITGSEALDYIEKKRKEINKKYKCYSGKYNVNLKIEED